MKIALIGYGKMGKAIERVAIDRGHDIVLRISSGNAQDMTPENLQKADVAIEFTGPDAALNNVLRCLDAGVNTISGSTGWNDALPQAKDRATEKDAAFLHASNFSVGVNIFFEVNKLLASLMNGRSEYKPLVEETHHVHKKDAPSGTAITIAEQMIAHLKGKTSWALNDNDDQQVLSIVAHRADEVPGTHKVTYSSPIDEIAIVHTAHTREGFAVGAVVAAEFIAGKQGVYTMQDVLGITA
jgi:4-hydroxy-tetrahydrodipicolinate reductase